MIDKWDTFSGRALGAAAWNGVVDYQTLDFLSDKAARSITYFAAQALIDSTVENCHPDHFINGISLLASEISTHGLGSILSHGWRTAFAREFLEKATEAAWNIVYNDNKWFDEGIERKKRLEQAIEETRLKKIADAKKVLEELI